MPGASIRFTKPIIPRLTCPVDKPEAFFWDATLPGFGLGAYAPGRRQWVARYRGGAGRTRRSAFGDVKTVALDAARVEAGKLLFRVEPGTDPQAEKQAARRAIRLGDLVAEYLKDAERTKAPLVSRRTATSVRREGVSQRFGLTLPPPNAAASPGTWIAVGAVSGTSRSSCSGPSTSPSIVSTDAPLIMISLPEGKSMLMWNGAAWLVDGAGRSCRPNRARPIAPAQSRQDFHLLQQLA
jgi:hypothetical protein